MVKRQSGVTLLLGVLFTILFLACGNGKEKTENKVETATDIQKMFAYRNDNSLMISGHRGSRGIQKPENSLETFRKITEEMPVFFEIDPRLTKDSVIVLMHDETLDRTTTATGKLSDYSWAELQTVYLKDSEGQPTTDRIPKLEDAIRWSKGKVVLNLDKKDVPMSMIVDLIKKCDTEEYIMLTVHTGAQARYYYDRFPHIMLSAFIRNEKEYEDMAISGVPWENMIAYVGYTIDDKNKKIVERLHKQNVKCMTSVAPTHDRLDTKEKRIEAYKLEIAKNPDIIESDYPLEVWQALREK
ncbi:glycerophosphodiester phosphodiesterase family protein [Massilibacteroides sp.]|uniref:glycerophosphodiester phosphodiesterase family protein n=1 Tax=Massilibacteroides sp. TaxID=2034766 RepID=UPI002622C1FF|nr:glycerophosphodiester phosphodiesterase family protein [Massilibacteroides sp.]MDD4516786.1 glycerophosphodiester phosphodiesterase family protein [Massilibacteroides sp.]